MFFERKKNYLKNKILLDYMNGLDELEREEAERYRPWVDRLRGINFDAKAITDLFKKDSKKVLGALYWSILNGGELSLDTDVGKRVWKEVRKFYYGHNKVKEWEGITRGLYIVSVSEARQEVANFGRSIVGIGLSALTAGVYPAWPIIEWRAKRDCNSFVDRRLGRFRA